MPYRLDLTVSVLRRLSTNVVDLLTPQGMYVRALSGFPEPVVVRVTQAAHHHSLCITIEGDARHDAAVLGLVRQVLGADRDLRKFYRAAAHIPWLAPLVKRMRGVKPPRYPSLWEACANAIVFQQLSLRAASAIMHRLILAVGNRLKRVAYRSRCTCSQLRKAFSVQAMTACGQPDSAPTRSQHCGGLPKRCRPARSTRQRWNGARARTQRQSCCRIKGIGPWTAAVILLRGLGRLDVFPLNDTSVARNVALIAGSAPFDAQRVLKALGPQRGMLYFHLLLGRLEARGEIGRQSFEMPQQDVHVDLHPADDPDG